MAALYKPLAEKNIEKISVIVKSTESFMRKVVLIFAGFTVILACFYPFVVSNEFDWFFTASLVLIMSLSTMAQYFFGQTYQFLLNADQRQRLISIINIFKFVANTVICVVMIHMGYGIRTVKLTATVVYVIAPVFVSVYAKKQYRIIANVKKDNSVIKQRWDNFGQQVATFVTINTDLVILSIFSNVYEVSVYAVYNLVFNAVYGLISTLTKGVEAAFGNMLAKEEYALLRKNLRIYEQVIFATTTFLFTIAIGTTLSFVSLYTVKVTDANYLRPLFLYIMIAAFMFRCFRFPYEGITKAAGHFRQTRTPAFVEAAINIGVSVILVFPLGIVGVAIGTLMAYLFRTTRFAIYVSKNIVQRSIWLFVKRVIMSGICVLLTIVIFSIIPFVDANSYITWALNAVIVAVIAFIMVLSVEVVFYHDDLMRLLKMIKGVLKKRKAIEYR